MLPSQWRARRLEDFIGPARKEAQRIQRDVELAMSHGKAPLKYLILGPSGIGKSELAEYFCQCCKAGKWAIRKYNGTQFKIEDAEDVSRIVHLHEMFGEYRVVRIEEVDKASNTAQVRLLTLLDDLPDGNAFVCTSNCRTNELEPRFHRRFVVVNLKAPSAEEITDFLCKHWPSIGPDTARMIAELSCGNVGQALMDAQRTLTA